MTEDEFRRRIGTGDFLEYEEVYAGCFYGTLKEQVEQRLEEGCNIIFDVDVVGACNIKKHFGERALSVFIMPPSLEELKNRLIRRGTDPIEVIGKRLAKAGQEIAMASRFDTIVVNDDLQTAEAEVFEKVSHFLNSGND